jgi:hypothetical protein
MSLFRRLGSWLLYGGSRTLRDYELQLLDFIGRALSDADRRALGEQLASLDHLKRLHDDRMVTLYFRKPGALPRFSNQGLEQNLATAVMATGEERVRVTAVAHRGLLSSLEFRSSPARLEGRQLRLELVTGRRGKDGALAAELDGNEHAERE